MVDTHSVHESNDVRKKSTDDWSPAEGPAVGGALGVAVGVRDGVIEGAEVGLYVGDDVEALPFT